MLPRHHWREVWDKQVDDEAVGMLRDAIRAISTIVPRKVICAEAEIHDYDLKNLLSPKAHRPGHWTGLKLLRFVSEWIPPAHFDKADVNRINKVKELARRNAAFDPDEDFLFDHLHRLKLLNSDDCKSMCDSIAGDYYSHRLSRRSNHIIRSHYKIFKFNPHNKVPRFVNRLRYGPARSKTGSDSGEIERTAVGQIFRIGHAYVLMGFVHYGYDVRDVDKYDGIQINIFPSAQFANKNNRIIDGIFLSFVYEDKYEYGQMKLLKSRSGFRSGEVGEFPFREIRKMAPNLQLEHLQTDVAEKIAWATRVGKPTPQLDRAVLNACFSFILAPHSIRPT